MPAAIRPSLSDADRVRLRDAAVAARSRAHAPYSGFHVGAALLAEDGTIFTGCNVEISSYGLTCCAERVAVFSAVAAGHLAFTAIAVVAGENHTPPCGACRQVLADFNPDMDVVLFAPDGTSVQRTLSELLPSPFLPKDLQR